MCFYKYIISVSLVSVFFLMAPAEAQDMADQKTLPGSIDGHHGSLNDESNILDSTQWGHWPDGRPKSAYRVDYGDGLFIELIEYHSPGKAKVGFQARNKHLGPIPHVVLGDTLLAESDELEVVFLQGEWLVRFVCPDTQTVGKVLGALKAEGMTSPASSTIKMLHDQVWTNYLSEENVSEADSILLDILGCYEKNHVTLISKESGWEEINVTDWIKIEIAGPGVMKARLELVGMNGHTCSWEGKSTYYEDGSFWFFEHSKYFPYETFGFNTLRVSVSHSTLMVEDMGPGNISTYYCGMRASIDEFSIERENKISEGGCFSTW